MKLDAAERSLPDHEIVAVLDCGGRILKSARTLRYHGARWKPIGGGMAVIFPEMSGCSAAVIVDVDLQTGTEHEIVVAGRLARDR